jgi:hypothetical protein
MKRKMLVVVEEANPHQHWLSALEGINTARKYLMRFAVNSYMMAAISSIQNKVYNGSRKKWRGLQPT